MGEVVQKVQYADLLTTHYFSLLVDTARLSMQCKCASPHAIHAMSWKEEGKGEVKEGENKRS